MQGRGKTDHTQGKAPINVEVMHDKSHEDKVPVNVGVW